MSEVHVVRLGRIARQSVAPRRRPCTASAKAITNRAARGNPPAGAHSTGHEHLRSSSPSHPALPVQQLPVAQRDPSRRAMRRNQLSARASSCTRAAPASRASDPCVVAGWDRMPTCSRPRSRSACSNKPFGSAYKHPSARFRLASTQTRSRPALWGLLPRSAKAGRAPYPRDRERNAARARSRPCGCPMLGAMPAEPGS